MAKKSDVPTFCQAKTLNDLGNRGAHLFDVTSWYLPSVLKALAVRGWVTQRKLKIYRTSGGTSALRRYREQSGGAML